MKKLSDKEIAEQIEREMNEPPERHFRRAVNPKRHYAG